MKIRPEGIIEPGSQRKNHIRRFPNDITETQTGQRGATPKQAEYLAEAQRLSLTSSFGWNVTSGEISWAEQSFRIFEYDPAIPPPIEGVLKRTHPDDVALVQETLDQAVDAREDFDFEHRLLMPDGSRCHRSVVIRHKRQGYFPGSAT